MTINDRIREIINKSFNGNVSAFCRAVGVKQSTMNTILGERQSKPSYDVINSVLNAAALSISADWLISGKGSMTVKETIEAPSISYTTGVPYYNVDFIGGFDIVLNDQTTKPEYLIDFKKYNEATCWCNVSGHSMEPEINNGDIIALKKIEDISFLPYGEVYAIVTTNDMRTIKRLGPSTNPDCYTLVPTNKAPEYGIQEIRKDMIRSVFQVLGCMKKL